ncbi:MAG: hypothetical protein HUU16_07435 [Candidatus Omnitrophica bacterium]|nr:hypothetical protein [Candidatus Omnitrophota bacterium]
MLEAVQQFFDFSDQTWRLRNDIVRVALAVFLAAFYLLSTAFILFDGPRKESDPAPDGPREEPEVTSPEPRKRPWVALAYTLVLLILVLAFPWLLEQRRYGWLIPAALVAGVVFLPESRKRTLSLRPPEKALNGELVAFAALAVAAALLALWRWDKVPIAMNGDVGTIAMSGRDMWRQHLHPLYTNPSSLPAIPDIFYGLSLILMEDQVFAMRVYPMALAALCPIVLVRWISLFAPRGLAWMAGIVFVLSPFFQYYSRVPMGTSLIFPQLVFLYGITRCLILKGVSGPILGGLGLGVAHWDYYAARVLVGYALTLPALLLPYWKTLARGWWLRLLALIVVAAPFVAAFPFQAYYKERGWTWSQVPAHYTLENQEVLRIEGLWKRKTMDHFRMWFDPTLNEARFMTVPGSPVHPFPLGGLLLVGTGLLALAWKSPALPITLWLFLLGTACSLVANGAPNGHRALPAHPALAVWVAIALYHLWPAGSLSSPRALKEFRRWLVLALLVLSAVTCLKFFQFDMWRDPKTIMCHDWDENARARRLLRDVDTCDVSIIPYESSTDRFLLDGKRVRILNFGDWLPANWARRPVSIQAESYCQELAGLPRSVFAKWEWEEVRDPVGTLSGWGYRTRGKKLGLAEVARQWEEQGRITGTLMLPQSGMLSVDCPGCVISYHNPAAPLVSEESGTFQALRGLTTLSLSPLVPGTPMPLYLRLAYKPTNGATEEVTLSPADLYSIPMHGWLKTLRLRGGAPGPEGKTFQSISPVIFTRGSSEDPEMGRAVEQEIRYTATVNLPSGTHECYFIIQDPRPVWVKLDGVELASSRDDSPERIFRFALTDRMANGKVLEVGKIERFGGGYMSLEIPAGPGLMEVPPYHWFTPAAPRDNRGPSSN